MLLRLRLDKVLILALYPIIERSVVTMRQPQSRHSRLRLISFSARLVRLTRISLPPHFGHVNPTSTMMIVASAVLIAFVSPYCHKPTLIHRIPFPCLMP